MRLHIEPTTRCILACPACPRTTWQQITKRPVAKEDLDIDLLEQFLDCDGGKKIFYCVATMVIQFTIRIF